MDSSIEWWLWWDELWVTGLNYVCGKIDRELESSLSSRFFSGGKIFSPSIGVRSSFCTT